MENVVLKAHLLAIYGYFVQGLDAVGAHSGLCTHTTETLISHGSVESSAQEGSENKKASDSTDILSFRTVERHVSRQKHNVIAAPHSLTRTLVLMLGLLTPLHSKYTSALTLLGHSSGKRRSMSGCGISPETLASERGPFPFLHCSTCQVSNYVLGSSGVLLSSSDNEGPNCYTLLSCFVVLAAKRVAAANQAVLTQCTTC